MMQTKRSWVAYDETCPFPIENLPYGVFHHVSEGPNLARVGVAIGSCVLDLSMLEADGLFGSLIPAEVFNQPSLNKFMSLGRSTWIAIRSTIVNCLKLPSDSVTVCNKFGTYQDHCQKAVLPQSQIVLLLPAQIGDYTDFYSSKEHATNLGRMFRPNDQPLLPNWLWIPVGYHGRASSIVPSGTPIYRPKGQVKPKDTAVPRFETSQRLDYELEMAFLVGTGNELGQPISIENADDHIFGVVLMNDWSARDIQPWEYVPLGPFTAKNFATTISPWVVTLEALAPFRVPAPSRDHPPLEYLHDQDESHASFDIILEVQLKTRGSKEPHTLSRSNFKSMYWTMRQQLVHHTVTGCNLRAGDLLGSGTISGTTPDSFGSLIELSWNGTRPIELEGGEKRTFIEDGDVINIVGYCEGDGYRIGFGPCSGEILPAISK